MMREVNAQEQKRIFDEWLETHRGLFFKVVRSYAFNPHDQDDLFQEIATQVWHSIPKYRQHSKVSTWIYRVYLYAAMAWSKKERRYRDRIQTVEEFEPTLLKPLKQKSGQLDWLFEQIGQLNEIDRSLTLLMLDGYSYREIAETLGITENHVGVKVSRLKKHLSARLEKEPVV